MDQVRLLSGNEVAKRLSCSPNDLPALRAKGLPFLRIGKRPKYIWDAVEVWVNEQLRKNTIAEQCTEVTADGP